MQLCVVIVFFSHLSAVFSVALEASFTCGIGEQIVLCLVLLDFRTLRPVRFVAFDFLAFVCFSEEQLGENNYINLIIMDI